MGESSSKRVENTVAKEEIAHYEQFLLLQQCFQRLVLQTHKTRASLGKGSTQIPSFGEIFIICKCFRNGQIL